MGLRSLASSLVLFACLFAAVPARAQSPDAFFDDGEVHDIHLSINSRDWTTLRQSFQENTYYPCDLRWRDLVVRNVGIRSRGSGSRSGTKPGLRVDMDRYVSGQRFLGLASFVLDNLTQDASMLKERLAMRVFARLGRPAPREAHVRLFVNGEYAGLYATVESIDKDFLRRVFGEDEGYLYEFNWRYEWRFHYPGDDLEPYAELFEPETHEREAPSVHFGPIKEMTRTVNAASDDAFEEEVARFLDPDDFIAHIAIENALAEFDGLLGYAGMNNFYLYRPRDSTRFRFIPWDKDNTFSASHYHVHAGMAANVLAARLTALPDHATRYHQVLLDVADLFTSVEEGEDAPTAPWLLAEIERQHAQIREAALADPFKPFTNEEFESATEELRRFAIERPRYLRCEALRELRRDAREVDAACRLVGQDQ